MGVEIDWSKAPEGTVGALVAKPDNVHFPEVSFVAWAKRVGCGIRAASSEDYRSLHGIADAWDYVERPAEPWTGEGLPPVGTVCEVLWNESRMEYLRTKVFGVNEHGQPIHRFDEGPKKYEYQADVLVTTLGTRVFRPIRTPEQIAAEERLHKIRDACTDIARTLDDLRGKTKVERAALAVVEAMIDAGYRKVTP